MKRTREAILTEIWELRAKKWRLVEELERVEEAVVVKDKVTVSWTVFEDVFNKTKQGWVKVNPRDPRRSRLRCDGHRECAETCPTKGGKYATNMYAFNSLDGLDYVLCDCCVEDKSRFDTVGLVRADPRQVVLARDAIEPDILAQAIREDE